MSTLAGTRNPWTLAPLNAHSFGAIWVLVAVHLLFLELFFSPAISTPDANGYMAQARLIANEGTTQIVVESPAQYVGDHWLSVAEGRYYGQYPPGLPAILAVVFRLFGPYASFYVIPLMGSLSLLALFLVVREWVGPTWALMASALMAVNPYFNAHALGADSHIAVCFFLLWALYGLVRWERSRTPGWAALAGLCLGIIPTVRYPETIFLIPFGVYVLMTGPRNGRWWRSVLAAIGFGSVPIVALALRNQSAFGAFWKTGYSISGEQTGFGPDYLAVHFVPYLFLLLTRGVGLLLPVGAYGLVALCRRTQTAKRGRLLVALVLPITLLYMAYYWHADGNSTRFLLPTFAFYTIAAVWLLKLRSETEPQRTRKWAKIILGVTFVWGLSISVILLSALKRDNQEIAKVTRLIEQQVEPGSIVIAQSGLLQHLDFLGQWRLAPEESFEGSSRSSNPVGPRSGPETNSVQADRLSPEQRASVFRDEIAIWAATGAGRRVYWLTTQAQQKIVDNRLNHSDQFTKVNEVEVRGRPNRPPDGAGPNGLPGMGRAGPTGEHPGGPAHFEAPADGKLDLFRWTILTE